ncbi:hypothetical protein BBJ28_00022279, partial [Nothophytophthora sp. Chile5]
MSDDAIRAKVAAKLRLAQQNGGGDGASQTNGKQGGRRLLRWDPSRWQLFERVPQYTTRVKSAPILPIRAPLSSIYEVHYSGRNNYAPSALMEKLIADTRSGSVVNVGTVIDATGSDVFLHDVKYVDANGFARDCLLLLIHWTFRTDTFVVACCREWDDWDVEYVKLRIDIPEGRATINNAEEKDRDAHDDQMVTAFCTAVLGHMQGERKDMDVAVFGSEGYNFVGFLIVRYLACPEPPRWEGEEIRKRKKEEAIGDEVVTDEDRAAKFVRKEKIVLPQTPSVKTGSSPVSNGKPSTAGGIPTPPTYKAPMYIPPDRQEQRPAKRRKIRSWMDDVQPLSYGESLATSSDEHQKLTKALEKLTGIEGFPGCE